MPIKELKELKRNNDFFWGLIFFLMKNAEYLVLQQSLNEEKHEKIRFIKLSFISEKHLSASLHREQMILTFSKKKIVSLTLFLPSESINHPSPSFPLPYMGC